MSDDPEEQLIQCRICGHRKVLRSYPKHPREALRDTRICISCLKRGADYERLGEEPNNFVPRAGVPGYVPGRSPPGLRPPEKPQPPPNVTVHGGSSRAFSNETPRDVGDLYDVPRTEPARPPWPDAAAARRRSPAILLEVLREALRELLDGS